MENENIQIKLIVIGNLNVGKTSIINQYISGTFDPKQSSTIGTLDYQQKHLKIEATDIKLIIFNSTGLENYSLPSSYLRNVNGIIIVFDLTDKKTLESLRFWINEVKKSNTDDVVIAFAGNKSDLEEDIEIEEEEIRETIEELGSFGNYYQTSAKSGRGVKQMFNAVIKEIMRELKPPETMSFSLKYTKRQIKDEKCC